MQEFMNQINQFLHMGLFSKIAESHKDECPLELESTNLGSIHSQFFPAIHTQNHNLLQSKISDIHVPLKAEISGSSIRVQNPSINQNNHKSITKASINIHGIMPLKHKGSHL
jgi:hypothetical protein